MNSFKTQCVASCFMYALYTDVAEQDTNPTPTGILLLTALTALEIYETVYRQTSQSVAAGLLVIISKTATLRP